MKISIIIFATIIVNACSHTNAITDQEGNVPSESLTEIINITLGGYEQSLIIRSSNTNNPVLLYLHGGPGAPETPLVIHYNRKLENFFSVVIWEQKGAGLSYHRHIDVDTMTIEQFTQDTLELTRYLTQRFNQEKVYILGHSWGCIPALLAVKLEPELYHAFISTGQVVNTLSNETLSYQSVYEIAETLNDKFALRKLDRIGHPPYPSQSVVRDTLIERDIVLKYGGAYHRTDNYNKSFLLYLSSTEYTFFDCLRLRKSARFSMSAMWESLYNVDFPSQITQIDVPVYLLLGRYDMITSYEYALSYFEQLEAPSKTLITFEHSAHSPQFEEPDKFNSIIIDTVLPQVVSNCVEASQLSLY